MDRKLVTYGVVLIMTALGVTSSCALVERPPVRVSSEARLLQPDEVSSVTTSITSIKKEVPSSDRFGEFIVEGERHFNGWALNADRIIFKPGSKLIFSQEALKSRASVFIFAREVTSESAEAPGRITWERPLATLPQDSGAATSGQDNGAHIGAPGGVGGAGRQGNGGTLGVQAPDLTIVANLIKSSLVVDLSGQSGGLGGKGQNGGRGGGGGRGQDAIQIITGCRSGADRGAQGGAGGDGGKGGTSGDGGRGGIFTLVTSAENVGAASRLIKVDVSGGAPGAAGGEGGDGGLGGPGGPGGAQQLPFCVGDGPQGIPGANGQKGPSGDIGKMGLSGDYFVGGLSAASVDGLFSRR